MCTRWGGFGAGGRHRAHDRASPWFGHLTGQLIGQLLSERRIVLFGGLILVSNQLESKPLPVSQRIGVSKPRQMRHSHQQGAWILLMNLVFGIRPHRYDSISQKRTFRSAIAMSALPPIADIWSHSITSSARAANPGGTSMLSRSPFSN